MISVWTQTVQEKNNVSSVPVPQPVPVPEPVDIVVPYNDIPLDDIRKTSVLPKEEPEFPVDDNAEISTKPEDLVAGAKLCIEQIKALNQKYACLKKKETY
jgi:hypothetical protein